MGMPGLPIVVIPHPVGTIPREKVEQLADAALEEIVYVLTHEGERLEEEYLKKAQELKKRSPSYKVMDLNPLEVIEIENSLQGMREANRLFYERGWTDGLPVIPPTQGEVSRMLEFVGKGGGEILGRMPPKWAELTLLKAAINAVMAGCLPSYFPVVLAALEAILDPRFNLYGVQATTNSASPLLVINGPLVKELDLNSGHNVFGQGWQSNATIGRAVRLTMVNVGGANPGGLDHATQGHPGKYTFCIAENEGANPWQPLHVERGFDLQRSTVTAIGCAGPVLIMGEGIRGEEILASAASTLSARGANTILFGGAPGLVLTPEAAAMIARDGFSKEDVKRFLFETARVPITAYTPAALGVVTRFRPDMEGAEFITIADRWEDIVIIVAGGEGAPHMSFLPTFQSSYPVTKAINTT